MSSASCDCHYNGSSNFFNKATNLCRFSCSRVFLPSSDKDTSSLAYISRCLSTSHSPSYRFLVCQVLSAGFSTQERRLCLRENLPFISGDNKMKRGFGTLYLSPLFVFVLYASLLSAPLWSLFIQLEASVPSLCPRGESAGRARLAECTGGWVTGTAECRMNSLDSLNPLLISIGEALSNNHGQRHTHTSLRANHYSKSSCWMHTC